jgi:glycosyltransferase involved in cell wall biosynthesis
MILKKIKNFDILYINGLFIESALVSLLREKKYYIRIPGDVIWERWKLKKGNNLNIDEFQNYKNSVIVNIKRKIRKFYLNRAERIIAPSYYLANLIEVWGVDKEKIEVIFNPYLDVKSEKINLDIIKKNSFNIITGGRLVKWKGIEKIIEVCKKLDKVNLIIVGDGPERENLLKFVKELKIEDKVNFTGILSRGQLKTLFKNSDCFVLNSRYEGLPHIVLEAMNSNCPVVISKTGGNIEVVDDKKTGLLFEIDNLIEIEKSIKTFKENSELKKKIINNVKKKIEERFDKDVQFEKTLKIISAF